MSLLTRLVNPAEDEAKIPVHQFMGVLAEYKRGAPGVTLSAINSAFSLAGQEQTDLAFVANLFVSDVITREMIHDVLMLGEYGIYTTQTCQDRILTAGTPNLTNVIFQAKVDAVRIGLNDFTLAGCAITPQGTPDMTLAVAKGSVMTNGSLKGVAAGNVTIGTADSALSRLDLVVISSAGTKTVRAGTPAATPAIGGFQAGDVPLALVYVPPGTTAIDAGKMMDVRIVRARGPVTIGKITTAVVKNNTSAQQLFIDFTIPNGLMTTGAAIRVNCGGTMLLNSGTPTVTLAIAFGGTLMFQDVTGASTNDTDRLAWALDFKIIAQSNTDQALNGALILGQVAAKTAANTGVGEIQVPSVLAGVSVSAPINGASAVDADAADRALQVAWTMSVANASDEIVMEYATAELV